LERRRQLQNSCGKSRAAAYARKRVLQDKWRASPTLFSSRFYQQWRFEGESALHVAKLTGGYETSR